MVVGTPHVDDRFKTALVLVLVVGDVRRKIGGLAVFTHNHPVFFITELRRAKPLCAALFIDLAAFLELDKRRINLTVRCQALLREPAIKRDAEFTKVVFDIRAD